MLTFIYLFIYFIIFIYFFLGGGVIFRVVDMLRILIRGHYFAVIYHRVIAPDNLYLVNICRKLQELHSCNLVHP